MRANRAPVRRARCQRRGARSQDCGGRRRARPATAAARGREDGRRRREGNRI